MEDLVYVIGPAGSHTAKIGHSVSPPQRLRQIQTMSPLSLAILWTCEGGEPLERRLHAYLRPYRTHGEWFDFGELDPVTMVQEAVVALQQGAEPLRLTSAEESKQPPALGPQPDCICGHQYGSHGAEGCPLYDGPEEWHKCQCVSYVSVQTLRTVPPRKRVPEPQVVVAGWQGPMPWERKAIVSDSRYSIVLDEISNLVWPGGGQMVPGWWPEHLAERLVWRLQQNPDTDRQPAIVLDEIVRMRWGRKDGQPMVPGVFAEQLTDQLMQRLV
ncbi:GIY-YIG nuclease family protein [Streptomyces sp. NPDC029006]|uniref:GIY-YIG nuclease family protein n=1 Tax=Streptomyces sp. NPDC029006 TaxID=3155467 RepID=UPI00340FEF2F